MLDLSEFGKLVYGEEFFPWVGPRQWLQGVFDLRASSTLRAFHLWVFLWEGESPSLRSKRFGRSGFGARRIPRAWSMLAYRAWGPWGMKSSVFRGLESMMVYGAIQATQTPGESIFTVCQWDIWGYLGGLVMVLSQGLGVQRVRGLIGPEHGQY